MQWVGPEPDPGLLPGGGGRSTQRSTPNHTARKNINVPKIEKSANITFKNLRISLILALPATVLECTHLHYL